MIHTVAYDRESFNSGGRSGSLDCTFKVRLKDNFIQKWQSELAESTRAFTYRNVSDSFDYKLYLDQVKCEKFRISLG